MSHIKNVSVEVRSKKLTCLAFCCRQTNIVLASKNMKFCIQFNAFLMYL